MDAIITTSAGLRGAPSLPADKAICHRAALLAALADGTTEIRPWSTAEDCQRTLELIQGLGVSAVRAGEAVRVKGVGVHGLCAPTSALPCGESGTTMRLACGVLAGQPFQSRLVAAASLARRPMRRIVDPLASMGVRIDGRLQDHEVYPPLTIQGQRSLTAITYRMPVASAQAKSAILLAGLSAQGHTEVIEPVQTRDHTERLLRHLGARITGPVVKAGGGVSITLEGPVRELRAPGRLSIPADPSSAAFFLVGALLVPGSEITIPRVAMNPSRVHFLHLLKRMGAEIGWSIDEPGWEPSGRITARSSALRGVRVTAGDAASMIDEVPILMVAACGADGETRFEGLGELTVKETDRLRSMTTGLAALGAQVDAGPSGVIVRRSRLRGAAVDSFGDHRTAMSLAVAGLAAEGETRIRGAGCVSKSLGNFFELLASVAGAGAVRTTDG